MILAIVGPTASGKTALSLEIADLLGGANKVEIISADAMQLYRGMDIGTAKLPPEQRRNITHHQLDVLNIQEEASVAAYQREARKNIESIKERGKIPLIVGGSGLYISGVLDELNFPGRSPEIRAQLEETLQSKGIAPLLEELNSKDPLTANTIDPRNPRRVIRALEVVRLTGHSYTPTFPRHTSHFPDTRIIGVTRTAEELGDSIEKRTRNMLEEGLIDETKLLMEQGLEEAPTARYATGYPQAIDVVHGLLTPQEAEISIAQATRKLAKKQRTWFKADPRITWVDPSSRDLHSIASSIVSTVVQ